MKKFKEYFNNSINGIKYYYNASRLEIINLLKTNIKPNKDGSILRGIYVISKNGTYYAIWKSTDSTFSKTFNTHQFVGQSRDYFSIFFDKKRGLYVLKPDNMTRYLRGDIKKLDNKDIEKGKHHLLKHEVLIWDNT